MQKFLFKTAMAGLAKPQSAPREVIA
jgi:hypothetical protein